MENSDTYREPQKNLKASFGSCILILLNLVVAVATLEHCLLRRARTLYSVTPLDLVFCATATRELWVSREIQDPFSNPF